MTMTVAQFGQMDEKYWLVGYDLPAESRTDNGNHKLTVDEKRFLNTKRKDVWQNLRRFGCIPVQYSLWNIREPDKQVRYGGKLMPALQAVRTMLNDAKVEYAKNGFSGVNIEIWPMATNNVGANYIKTSQMRFVFDAIQKAEKTVDEAIKKKLFKTRKWNDLDMRVEDMRNMFIEDFSVRHERWVEFEQIYMRLRRKMDDDKSGLKAYLT